MTSTFLVGATSREFWQDKESSFFKLNHNDFVPILNKNNPSPFKKRKQMCFQNSLIAFVTEHYRMIKIHKKYLVVTQEFHKESKQVFSGRCKKCQIITNGSFKIGSIKLNQNVRSE